MMYLHVAKARTLMINITGMGFVSKPSTLSTPAEEPPSSSGGIVDTTKWSGHLHLRFAQDLI